MGFGDTAKRIQTLADKAEQTYQRLNELRTEVQETQTTVTDTAERVAGLENEMAEQRAVLDAVAREVGVDLEAVSTEAHIVEAEDVDASDDGAVDGEDPATAGSVADADGGEDADRASGEDVDRTAGE